MQTIGHESINEIIVDRILNLLNINHVHYQLIHAKININNRECTTYLCKSADFKKEKETSISLGLFYELQKKFNNINTPLELFKFYHWTKQIYDMIIADFITLQRDRHFSNFEIIRDINNKYKPAPLFDHGLSLILEENDNKIKNIDVLEDKKVQSFIGSNSTYQNLKLIDNNYLFSFNSFIKETDKTYIFNDLNNIISPILLEATWEMIYLRSELLKEYIQNEKFKY